MYCFANWKKSKGGSGREPNLPKNIESFLTIWSDRDCPWGLFESDDLIDQSDAIELVSDELDVLLGSTKAYPPALILAVRNLEKKKQFSKEDFEKQFCKSLKKYLRKQTSDPFIMVKSKVDEIGYIAKGEFVWVIQHNPKRKEVGWISSDYQLYTNPADHFKVTKEQLSKLIR